MRPRGMRDVPTAQTMTKRSKTGREQAITDLARLEHEKARLERELSVWTTKQAATDRRLEQVRSELAQLQLQLEYTTVSAPAAAPRRTRAAADQGTEVIAVDGQDGKQCRMIPWEY